MHREEESDELYAAIDRANCAEADLEDARAEIEKLRAVVEPARALLKEMSGVEPDWRRVKKLKAALSAALDALEGQGEEAS